MASVTFDKATRLYPGSTRPAVDQIDLEVADGEFLVLVGPSPPCACSLASKRSTAAAS